MNTILNSFFISAIIGFCGGILAHDFDIRDTCMKKGITQLFIYKTSITCTVNVEK